MSDDHAAHAISAYGNRINRTPHLDRIADGDSCFCTNSLFDLEADPPETTNVIDDPAYVDVVAVR